MKTKIIYIISFALFFSCAEKASDKKDDEVVITKIETKEDKKIANPEKIKDCDDFLDTFEGWSNDLLKHMEKHEGDPVGLATSSEYLETMTKGMSFIQSWENIAVSCSMNPSYEARMKAIQKKMDKRQKELGF